ncbi:conserved hypothetical protein [Ricinus communis]|uniref:Reverse transcriptase domain-containing protein n=1 Tax=Ricinus communis TaxID=3988 RepID=B9RZ70_RICCO|nr:conserved hypothetical protein [Ricinus communis]
MERLAHIIDRFMQDGNWSPVHINRGSPSLTHLFFADDLLLFAEATLIFPVRKRLLKVILSVASEVVVSRSSLVRKVLSTFLYNVRCELWVWWSGFRRIVAKRN